MGEDIARVAHSVSTGSPRKRANPCSFVVNVEPSVMYGAEPGDYRLGREGDVERLGVVRHSDPHCDEICAFLGGPDCPHDGYYVGRRNYFMGKWIRHRGGTPTGIFAFSNIGWDATKIALFTST